MSKDIKKALEHCIEWNCADCPNREELGSGETVCRGRLLPEVLEYVADLEAKLAEKERQIKLAEELLIKQEKEYDEQLEKQAKIHYKHLKEKDQDKISFALEQLEKVKELLLSKAIQITGTSVDGVRLYSINEIFSNQIKQLKEMK